MQKRGKGPALGPMLKSLHRGPKGGLHPGSTTGGTTGNSGGSGGGGGSSTAVIAVLREHTMFGLNNSSLSTYRPTGADHAEGVD